MTSPSPEAEHFFPRYERLREVMGELRLPTLVPFDEEIDLLQRDCDGTAELAAIVMRTRIVVRKTWSDVVEISTALFDTLDTVAPPALRSDDPRRFESREHHYRMHDAKKQRCTLCAPIQAGLVFCGVCSGRGTRTVVNTEGDHVIVSCDQCKDGLAKCPTCEGSGESIVVEVSYASDVGIDHRRVVMPDLEGDLDDKVKAIVESITELPDALRIDLRPAVVASAYRGAIGVETPSLAGFDYMDAHARAVASVVASPEGTILREDETWGWPFLCVRWTIGKKEIDVAIVPGADGEWRAVFAGPPLLRTP
ncbi:MAG: hypothetical protein JST00_32630 [Deltaproteobacteria bacterium]|nr:hypothetical protein [Deltaproteobacteria bacterium]